MRSTEFRRGDREGDQLDRYEKTVRTEFPDVPSSHVFLTVEGDEPSEEAKEGWVPYSYGDLHRVLARVKETNRTSIGDDALVFLDHYLRLIRGRLMDDDKIVELCQRIYKNYRQALKLIYEHAGSPAAGLLGDIEQLISDHPGNWHIVNRTSRAVFFVPSAWLTVFPEISDRKTFHPRCWVVLRFELRNSKGFLGASVWPTTNQQLRQEAIQRLTADKKEFGFRLQSKATPGRWTQLGRESIGAWSEDDGPNDEAVLQTVKIKLVELGKRLAGVPDAMRPIFEN